MFTRIRRWIYVVTEWELMSAELRRVLTGIIARGEVYRCSKAAVAEADALGLSIQREHPLHEPPFWYAAVRRFDRAALADWISKAEQAMTRTKMT
jgi:hypothetical protein